MPKILIIDDDVDICTLLKKFFERNGYEVTTSFKAVQGLGLLTENDYDLVLSDFRLPDYDGLALIKEIKAIKPNLPVIVITGYSDVKQAVKVIQLGAFEYVTKPIFPEEILLHVERALDQNKHDKIKLPKRHTKEVEQKTTHINDDYVQGSSDFVKNVELLIDKVAQTNFTVMLIGESGTGKEVAAKRIHNKSKRKNKPFVAVDCGALSEELAGSELFGHVKGAFTGAIFDKKGFFEQAEGGTIFLDEIGNLSLENQIKLLRALQEKQIRRVGDEKSIHFDVRIITATNENLENAIGKGIFRTDLYHRINEFPIYLPSLRQQIDDITLFIDYFIKQTNLEIQKEVKKCEADVLAIFKKYNWPGNIRELKNVIRRAVLLTDSDRIETNNIPEQIVNFNDVKRKNILSLNLKENIEDLEFKLISKALKQTNNNKSKASELLGIERKTLYSKIEQYEIKL